MEGKWFPGLQDGESIEIPNRIDHGTCIVGNLMFVFGGYSKDKRAILNDLLSLQVKTQTWTIVHPSIDSEDNADDGYGIIPAPRVGHSLTQINEFQFLLFGGSGEDYYNTLHLFDINEQKWKQVQISSKEIPNARSGHIAEWDSLSNSLLVHGGTNGKEVFSDFWMLKFDCLEGNITGSWMEISSFDGEPSPQLQDHVSAIARGALWLYGGVTESLPTSVLYRYSIASRIWKKVQTVGEGPIARSRHASAIVNTTDGNAFLIVVGGTEKDRVFPGDMWIFNMKTCQWAQVNVGDEEPLKRHDHTLSVITSGDNNQQLLMFGGKGKAYCDSTVYFCDATSLLKGVEEEDVSRDVDYEISLMPRSVYTCGYGGHGQLGLGHSSPSFCQPHFSRVIMPHSENSHPTEVVSFATNFVNALAVTKKGTVWCWGDGVGDHPIPVGSLKRHRVTQVSVGALHFLALTDRGDIYGLGNPIPGPSQRGAKLHAVKVSIPKAPADIACEDDRIIVQIVCGSVHSLALTKSGLVLAWGVNNHGQCGMGTATDVYEASYLPFFIETKRATLEYNSDKRDIREHSIVRIAAGGSHSAAMSGDGWLYTWGMGIACGHGDENDVLEPRVVEALKVIKIGHATCGDDFTFAVAQDSMHVFSFGSNKNGKLGLGDEENRLLPTLVPSFEDVGIQELSVSGAYGHGHGLALTRDGELMSWGSGAQLRLGHGNQDAMLSPKRILNFEQKVAHVYAGAAHIAVVTAGTDLVDGQSVSGKQALIPNSHDIFYGATSFDQLEHVGSKNEEEEMDDDLGPLFSTLPDEIIELVFSFLDAHTLAKCAQTCTILHDISSSDFLWKPLFHRCPHWKVDTGVDAVVGSYAPMFGWKQLYCSRYSEFLAQQERHKFFSNPDHARNVSSVKSVWGWISNVARHPRTLRAFMAGDNASGKTTLLYSLMGMTGVTTIPTIGFNVETVHVKMNDGRDAEVTCWDVGGCDKIRPLWRHYHQGTDIVMGVIDSMSILEEWGEYAVEIFDQYVFNADELLHCPIVFFATKQDLPNAATTEEIIERMDLRTKLQGRKWKVFEVNALLGVGIHEAMQWAVRNCE